MSNLIKYPFVNMQGKEARVLQYETEDEKFVPLEQKKRVLVKPLEEVEMEKDQQPDEENAEFEAGLPVTNFDEVWKEKEEEAKREIEKMRESAQNDAELMLAEARKQVEEIREAAREEGIGLGKEEGMNQAREEMEQLRADLLEQKQRQEAEYQKLISSTEGHYVEIVCNLLRKLTGVVLTDNQELILHLIRSGIADMEPAKKYVIRVCSADMLYVEGKKEDIANKTGITGTIEIQEEKGLAEGECIIETDTQMIDCGIHTQLDNLIHTLRMLAK